MLFGTLTFAEKEYLSPGFNMSRNSLRISDTTKTEVLELMPSPSDREI